MSKVFEITPTIDEDRARLLTKDARLLDKLLDDPLSGPKPIAQTGFLEHLGGLLWEASGLDSNRLVDALGEARANNAPVRIVVTGNDYQHLPWELLYHGHEDLGFLGRHPWCVIVRRTRGRGDKKPEATAKPLRILLFISSPEDLDPERSRLDFEKEEELLFTALDKPWSKGEIDVDVAEDGVLATLLDRLNHNRYDAVILSMHGVKASENEWGLLFEDGMTGRGQVVAGSDLASRLDRVNHRPGLIVLSACRSAKVEESADAVPDVARRIHEKGYDRVLGMRLSVDETAAAQFTATLFGALAQGQGLGRAVANARDHVAQDDPFAQWTLPVLLDGTAGGPLLDLDKPGEPIKRRSQESVLIGDGRIMLPERGLFIGRRRFLREHLRGFIEGKTPRLYFTGPGGVGKTTLAGQFVRRLTDRDAGVRSLGFRAPFDLQTVSAALQNVLISDGRSVPSEVQLEADRRARISLMLRAVIGNGEHPWVFLLDNLESIQDLGTLAVTDEDSLWFLQEVCGLPAPARVLATGRYALEALPDGRVRRRGVLEAPLGDVLRRMKGLEASPAEKKAIYQAVGGNHRAIEWTIQLLESDGKKAAEVAGKLAAMQAPPETPKAAVEATLELMRQNLLLAELREQLTEAQDRLLRAASLYRVPVNVDGLLAVESTPAEHEANRQRLLDYSLLESAYNPGVGLEYYFVPPIVKELLGEAVADVNELRALHHTIGDYHRFQGAHVSRLLGDRLEAIHHYCLAGEHEPADAMAYDVTNHYWTVSNFAEALSMASMIVERNTPPGPGWAWNMSGMCHLRLGKPAKALSDYGRALQLSQNRRDRSAVLNNISQIHRTRGDYNKALELLMQSLLIAEEIGDRRAKGEILINIGNIYREKEVADKALEYTNRGLVILREVGDRAGEVTALNNIGNLYREKGVFNKAVECFEQSLQILRKIGDRMGMSATLHNMGLIAKQAEDNTNAMQYCAEAHKLAIETQNAEGIFHTSWSLGEVLAQVGQKDQARRLLEMAVAVGRRAGFPQTAQVEAILRNLG